MVNYCSTWKSSHKLHTQYWIIIYLKWIGNLNVDIRGYQTVYFMTCTLFAIWYYLHNFKKRERHQWSRKKRHTLPGTPEAVAERCSVKKVFLEISQYSQENTCVRVSFLIKLQACNFNKKETLAQVFSCKFWEISKSTFSNRTPPVAASWTLIKVLTLHACFSRVLSWTNGTKSCKDHV